MTTESPQPKFSIGDVVQLNSGGPLMTVNSSVDPTNIECAWFYDVANTMNAAFHQNCLRLATVDAVASVSA